MVEPKIAIVPVNSVTSLWASIAPALEKAVNVAGGIYSVNDILQDILNQKSVLWVTFIDGAFAAACVTKIVQYPRAKALVVEWVGGKHMDLWLDAWYGKLLDFGRVQGCTLIEGYGRDGWTRVMERKGMKRVYTTYRAEI